MDALLFWVQIKSLAMRGMDASVTLQRIRFDRRYRKSRAGLSQFVAESDTTGTVVLVNTLLTLILIDLNFPSQSLRDHFPSFRMGMCMCMLMRMRPRIGSSVLTGGDDPASASPAIVRDHRAPVLPSSSPREMSARMIFLV
jgi:hypothetical protein